MTTDPIEPSNVNVTVTTTDRILIEFGDGRIPDLTLDGEAAKKLGSVVASQADRTHSPAGEP